MRVQEKSGRSRDSAVGEVFKVIYGQVLSQVYAKSDGAQVFRAEVRRDDCC